MFVAQRRILVLAAVAASLTRLVTGQEHKGGGEQSIFALEGMPVSKPVSVSAAVVRILKENDLVKQCYYGETAVKVSADWFSASEIHLTKGPEVDLVVFPHFFAVTGSENRCLFGAHSMPFWVFRNTASGYDLILEDNVQELQILPNISNGYRDIETSLSTTLGRTVFLYRFDGHSYKIDHKSTTPP